MLAGIRPLAQLSQRLASGSQCCSSGHAGALAGPLRAMPAAPHAASSRGSANSKGSSSVLLGQPIQQLAPRFARPLRHRPSERGQLQIRASGAGGTGKPVGTAPAACWL
jgi:hypothetical protein